MLRKLIIFLSLLYLSGCATIDQQEINYAKENNIPLVVSLIDIYHVNSVGGIDVRIKAHNLAEKDIKYIYYKLTPYNAVGDKVYSSVGKYSEKTVKATGPFYANQAILGIWERVWYNFSIRCFEINSIKIDYMDGSTASINDDDLNKIYSKTAFKFMNKKCSY